MALTDSREKQECLFMVAQMRGDSAICRRFDDCNVRAQCLMTRCDLLKDQKFCAEIELVKAECAAPTQQIVKTPARQVTVDRLPDVPLRNPADEAAMISNQQPVPPQAPQQLVPVITPAAPKWNIEVLSQYEGRSYSEMLKELGRPSDKTGYTIANAPTKSWNHAELFTRYPKTPANSDVQIMEVAWDAGDFMILACYHMVAGENRCLVAKRLRKGIKF